MLVRVRVCVREGAHVTGRVCVLECVRMCRIAVNTVALKWVFVYLIEICSLYILYSTLFM